MENVEIAKIRRDGGTQPRAALDEATIAEYADAIQAGAEMPAVVVFNDGERLWLADGFHRLAAHERAGKHFILATIHQGDQRAAVLFSTGVNADHGLRRSDDDKRRSVNVLLRDAEWHTWSNMEIARQCKVSESLVRAMRKELSSFETKIDPPTERTVTRAGSTYTMQTAPIGTVPTAWVTVDQLLLPVQAAVLELARGDERTARALLTQISLYSPQGNATLTQVSVDPGLPRPARMKDIKAACMQYLEDLKAADRPAPRVVYTPIAPPEASYASVKALEQGIRKYLDARAGMLAAGETALGMLEGMWRRSPAQGKVDYDDLRMNEGFLPRPYREGDLQQALANVMEQMRREKAKAEVEAQDEEPVIRTEAEVDVAAAGLRWVVRTFLRTADGTGEREALEHAARLTGSLLDLEGFHAARGRNFDWEALVAEAGPAGQSDKEALRRAVELERAVTLEMLAALDEVKAEVEAEGGPATAVSAQAASQVEDEEQPDVVALWLQGLAEEQEIPQDRNGAPDREAARMLLQRILTGRTNGGEPAWRSLRYHPCWPEAASNDDKLAAVRTALAKYNGAGQPAPVPATTAPAQRIADPQVRLLVRKNEHIAHLVTAVEQALGYLKSLAAHQDDPDDELIETIAALEAARAAARNED